jgi:hypothetical protein
MDDQVISELAVVARWLMDNQPDATWADLLRAYFQYKSGVDYSDFLTEPPKDEDIIEAHLMGLTPTAIAAALEDYSDYIRWVLITLGFCPMTSKDTREIKDGTSQKLLAEKAKYEELKSNGVLQ